VRLLLATHNRHKVGEIQSALASINWEIVTLSALGDLPEVEEDGVTLGENARKKARSAAIVGEDSCPRFCRGWESTPANRTPLWTLAEDSGLEIDALGGEPGVRSARYCGPGAPDEERMRKVLAKMAAVPTERRRARFRCVMCLIGPEGNEVCFEGECEGRIAHEMRGSAGFGYDPIFIPRGYDKTFGELGPTVKMRISHRARALQEVVSYLRTRESDRQPG